MRAVAGLILALVAATAGALEPPFVISTFDEANDQTGTATDLIGGRGLCTIEASADQDVSTPLCTNARCSRTENGGHTSSRRSGQLDLTSGEVGGWKLCEDVSVDRLAIGFAFHSPSAGGVGTAGGGAEERTLARVMQGASEGCRVTQDDSRTVRLYFGGDLIGTAAQLGYANSCSGDTEAGCSLDADCVSDDCLACSLSDGSGCFWPYGSLEQTNYPSGTGSKVQCILRINGVKQAASDLLPVAGSIAPITNGEVGAPKSGETGTVVMAFDDVAIGQDPLGHLKVLWLQPSQMAGTPTAVESNCGSGTSYVRCIDDYNLASNYNLTGTGTDDTIGAKNGGTATVARWTPALVPDDVPLGASIAWVGATVVGRTADDNGAWQTTVSLAQCGAAGVACEKFSTVPSVWNHAKLLTPQVTGLIYDATVPGSSTAWSVPTVNKVGVQWEASIAPAGVRARWTAGGVVVAIRRPDEPVVENAKDHNLGTEDGVSVCAQSGDSIACGTVAGLCRGGSNDGKACNQRSYCSWDGINKSKPAGDGCNTDAECRTCELRRLEFNAGAGYPCSGSCDFGTCSSGRCTGGDGDIPCAVNADCQMGTCDTTATCIESCPGGTCPPPAGWPYFSGLACDAVLNCCQDGATTGQLLEISWPGLLYGVASNCKHVSGQLGRCECTSDAECGSVSGTCSYTDPDNPGRCQGDLRTTCDENSDCASNVCLGRCTASDNGRDAAASASACASSRLVTWPAIDYLLPGTGANDRGWLGFSQPDCRQPLSNGVSPNAICNNCGTPVTCADHEDCETDVGTGSQCLGRRGAASFFGGAVSDGCMGLQMNGFEPTCSTDTAFCRVDSDCRTGQTCDGETGGPAKDGICVSQENADCAAGYVHSGGLCRKSCSVNADCGEPSGVCASGICQGLCTCPCDLIPCQSDRDCPARSVSLGTTFPVRTARGKCVSGHCEECGQTTCPSAPEQHAFRNNYIRWALGDHQAEHYRALDKLIAFEATKLGGDTTVPLVIPVTFTSGRAESTPVCAGWDGLEVMANRSAVQLIAERPLVADVRPCMAPVPWDECFTDVIHTGVACAVAMGECVGGFFASLNSCRTGTGPASRVARYCQEPGESLPSSTLCPDGTCAGAARCVQRLCTTDDDNTTTGCPGAPTCFLE